MRKAILGLLILGFLLSPETFARKMDNTFGYVYLAAGRLYRLQSWRLGRDYFEIGQVASVSYGLGGIIRSSSQPYFVTLGLAPRSTSKGKSWGWYGSIGLEARILSFLNIRGELIALNRIENSGAAEILLGAVAHW